VRHGSVDVDMRVTDRLRSDLTSWCQDTLYTPAVREATRLLDRYCDLQLCDLYRELDLATHLRTPKTAEQLAAALGMIDTASIALREALRRLGQRTGAVCTQGSPQAETHVHVATPPDPNAELAQVRAAMIALGPDYAATTEFIDFGRASFVRALTDEPDFMDEVLSGRNGEAAPLWYRATNVDPLQDLHGAMGARVVGELLERGTVLELGGGTGNGTRHLVRHLAATGRLHALERLVFTDISMRFVLATKHELGKAYPTVPWAWQFFDLNESFTAQKVEPASVDLVYAVNTAHVARDIVGFLRRCHQALRPGGMVVFAERVRMRGHEMAPRELTLNLSRYHRSAAEPAPYRPMHCYLAPAHWHDVIDRAGFTRCDVLPELDALGTDFPEQYAAVVVGTK
jgi:SAM-dependent methyltransferase